MHRPLWQSGALCTQVNASQQTGARKDGRGRALVCLMAIGCCGDSFAVIGSRALSMICRNHAAFLCNGLQWAPSLFCAQFEAASARERRPCPGVILAKCLVRLCSPDLCKA